MMPFRMPDFARSLPVLAALLVLPASAIAQTPEPAAVLIAVPTLATAKTVETDAGDTWTLANQIAELISADLGSTSSFIVADVKKVRIPSFPEVTAPAYPQWRAAGVKLLLSGFVNARSDGRLTIGCYVYDVQSGRELTRQGFAVTPSEWRRAAHRCADAAYVKATGGRPLFDSRIAYVAQSGSGDSSVRRLAVMDFDGASHAYLTSGDAIVVTPHWSPGGKRIAYTSLAAAHVHVRIVDVATNEDRALLPSADSSWSPAFAPDGRTIALSMSTAGNVDIFAVDVDGGYPKRLTTSTAIDTSPNYSPDGSQIAFVSDRSGLPQLYVMDADGSNQRRISFGGGQYGSPMWSPDGERIAFAKGAGAASRIGVMNSNGSSERIVSTGTADEQPSWSPNGARILFQRLDPASRRSQLASVPADGGEERTIVTPQGASDADWAERQE
jgi:TolB protein